MPALITDALVRNFCLTELTKAVNGDEATIMMNEMFSGKSVDSDSDRSVDSVCAVDSAVCSDSDHSCCGFGYGLGFGYGCDIHREGYGGEH